MNTAEKIKKADALIASAKGTLFHAEFVKKDGTIRKGKFRTGVSQFVSGEGRKYNPKDYGLRGVYEFDNAEGAEGKEAYRNINLATIKLLIVNGKAYRFK